MTTEDAKLLEDAIQIGKSAHRRLDRLEQEVGDLQKLTEAVAVTANNVERLQEDITEMKLDIKDIASAPADRWNAVVGYVMAALVSGLVGTMLGIFFK